MGLEIAVGTWISMAMTAASAVYQYSQQQKMKKKREAEADKRKGFMIPTRGSAAYVPVVYGKQAIGGIDTMHLTSDSFNSFSSNASKTFVENFNTSSKSGSKNEYLFVQTVLSQGSISGVVDIYVDDVLWNRDKSKFNHRFEVHNSGGTSDNLANANGILQTNKFTGCAYVTSAYKLNRDDPQYNGLPSPMYFVKGVKVKKVNKSGNNYSLSSSRSYSNNPALCLLDYLTNDKYGRGLSSSEIDLASFYRSAQICDTVVTTNRVMGGRVNGVDPILEFSNSASFPTKGAEDKIYKAENTGYFYKWIWDTFDQDGEGEDGHYEITTVNKTNIKLYECNISLDTEAKLRDNIEKIMNTMGLAELIWSSEGKYKLLLEYPANQAALDDLVHPTHEFTEDNIIREPLSISYLSAVERLNQVTCTFLNEYEDFKSDTVTWPETFSSAYNTYISEDNNQPFKSSQNLEGITDPYHATAMAEQLVRQSREMKTVKLKLDKSALSLEPGDFFKLTSSNADIDGEKYRAMSVAISDDLTVDVEAYLFTVNMLAWNIDDDISYVDRPVFDFELEEVSNLATYMGFYLNNDGTVVNYMDITWTHPGSYSFEIRWKRTGEPVSSYRSIETRLQTYRVLGIEPDLEYDVQVRAISSLGTGSSFKFTQGTNLGKITPPAKPTGLTAVGVFEAVELDWTNPADKDLRTVQVWESADNVIGNSYMVATTAGSHYHRGNLGISQERYYWVRAEDTSGNLSGYTGPVSATTTFIDDDAYENGIRALFEDQGLYAIEDVETLPATAAEGQQVYNRDDGKLYKWISGAWEAVIPDIQPDSITETEISDNAISTPKLAANAVTASKITAGTITGDKISANTITGGLIAASGVITNTAQINDSLITNAKIQNAAITTAKIQDATITNAKIANAAITNAKISNLDAGKINAGVLNTSRINLGNLSLTNTSGVLTVKSEGIETVHVRNSAITASGSATGSASTTSSSWQTVASFSYTGTSGKPTVINSYCVTSSGGTGTDQSPGRAQVRILHNNSQKASFSSSHGVTTPLGLTAKVSSSGGTNTVVMQMRNLAGSQSSNASVGGGVVWAVELKK